MNNFFENNRIVVTGGAGFLGQFVVKKLQDRGCKDIFVPRSKEYDFCEIGAIKQMYDDFKPDIIIHLAAVVGGIGANRDNPGKFFYDNAIMGIQLIEHGRKYGLKKFVCIGTICAYPKHTPVPFKENDLWNGYPEETNAPYGLAKKMLLVQLQAYRQQYGFNGIYLLPVNLYGPGDNFDPASSHVIPAMIRKFIRARDDGLNKVILWGDGSPTREFIYAIDAAEAIVLATENYNSSKPVNIGSGFEISVKELSIQIANLIGFTGEIVWDIARPNGQPRRRLDTSRAYEAFNFKSKTELIDGLQKTITWYETEVLDRHI